MKRDDFFADNVQIRLKRLKRNQVYLCKIFGKSPSQVSQAIHTDLYPTLQNKILTHLKKLENRVERIF